MTGTSRRSRRAAVGAMLAVVPVLLLSGSCSGPQRAENSGSTPPAASRPGLSGPVGPHARPCHGITVTAAEDPQRVIDAHPPGTTFCLSAGTHRLQRPLVPKRGDALVAARGRC
jgi:hypothetical protein